MLIALFVIIGLSILIIGHEAGHFFVAKLFKLRVDEFGFGFPPKIFRKKKGETEYSLNWLPFGGFVKIAGESRPPLEGEAAKAGAPAEENKRLFYAQPAWKKSVIIAAGVAMNFFIGWILLSAVLLVGTPKAIVVSQVQKDSPAAAAGIMSGDVIKGFESASAFIDFVNSHRGEKISLAFARGGGDLTIAVTPRIKVSPGEGAVGVEIVEAGEARTGFFSAIWGGLKESVAISGLILLAFYGLIKNLLLHGSLLEGIVGPVGVFSVAQETGRVGFVYLVQLVSLISVNLAVINLIPFPALDGGRLLFILIEKIKGSPIPRRVEAIVNGLGFAFIILLMALLTVRDVGRLF